jgi:hypothetical protein
MRRPWEVTFLGGLFIAAGSLAGLYHATHGTLDRWMPVILLVEVVAIIGGVFLILGRSWARWVVLGWQAFHVVVGALNSISAALAHAVLLAAIAYFLLTPPASLYFRRAPQ